MIEFIDTGIGQAFLPQAIEAMMPPLERRLNVTRADIHYEVPYTIISMITIQRFLQQMLRLT